MATPLQIELDTKKFTTNTVMKIGDDYYSERQVDSGLVIDATKIVIDRPNVNGVKLDIRKVNTPIGTVSFIMKDDSDETTTIEIMKNETMFLEKDVIVYLGVVKGAVIPFDFSDYVEVSRTKITGVKKISNGYSMTAKELTHKLDKPALNFESSLTTNLIPSSVTLDIRDATGAPFTSGLIIVDSEIMSFNGISGDTLLNLVRGLEQTTSESHNVGESVKFITEFNSLNPMVILLQIMLSKTGDGSNHATYDVLNGGLGLLPEEVDITKFETLRDGEFLNEQMDLLTFGFDKILKFMEDEILSMTISRFITVNGKISMTVLDQVNNAETVPEINESSIVGTPTWGLNSDKIINRIIVFYDFNYGTGVYESQETFNDTDSQNTFEVIKTKKLKWKGVTTGLDGLSIATNRAGRFLARLSTARGAVKVIAHLDATETPVGDNALLSHRFLPQEGGKLGMSQQLEIQSKKVDLASGKTTINMEFTSYAGIRAAFIAPSPFISAIVDQKTFSVPDGNCYRVGNVLKIWDSITRDYLPDTENVIASINVNQIVMVNDWATALVTTIKLKQADYDKVSDNQKSRYAFVGFNAGTFSDGSKSYQILF